MANAYYQHEKLYELATDDILHAPNGSAIWVRKIFFQCSTETDGVNFHMLSPETTADSDVLFTNINITASTGAITDAATGTEWSAGAVGDWVHIVDGTQAVNKGWYYLKTYTDGANFNVEVGDNIDGARTLADATGETYHIRIYTPKVCMAMVNDTIGGASSIHHPTLDWGEKGRFFPNLGMYGFAGSVCYLYLR